MGATSKIGNDHIDAAPKMRPSPAIHAERVNSETKEAILEVQRMKADPMRGKTYSDVDVLMKNLLQ